MNKIYFLYGDDLISIYLFTDNIVKEHSENNSGFQNIEKINLTCSEDFNLFYSQGLNLSIFNQSSILKIYLLPKSIKYLNENLSKFTSYIKSLSENKTIIIIFSVDNFDKSVKKQLMDSAIYKELRSLSQTTEYIKLKPWQINEIKDRVSLYSEKINLKFESQALNLFVDCFKDNLDFVYNELNKLQLFLMPECIVTEETVSRLYSLSASIDSLFDALLLKNKVKLVKLVDNINALQPLLYTLASLQSKFRQSIQLKSLQESSCEISQIAKITGLHPYRTEKEIMRLKKISLNYLKCLALKLSDCEFKLKSGLISNDKALDMVILSSAIT